MAPLWKCFAELGLRRVFLTNSQRVENSYFNSNNLGSKKYSPLLLQGLEQAAIDTCLPEVRIEKKMKWFLEDDVDELCPPGEVLRLLCHPGTTMRVTEAITGAGPEFQRVLLAIGPEGGWIDSEVELFERHGFQKVSLGPRVLTTEMAVVSSMALSLDALAAKNERKALATGGEGTTAGFGVEDMRKANIFSPQATPLHVTLPKLPKVLPLPLRSPLRLPMPLPSRPWRLPRRMSASDLHVSHLQYCIAGLAALIFFVLALSRFSRFKKCHRQPLLHHSEFAAV
eukprot:gnl/MRDRNA2_/MRDRNA2_66740_c0_seq2.p1 gnl/MRDRNA2_/MRDRNA2_66740_c0~~gnl/MRDRNA2_/MRDRNA2_66740_c0_seq2.p1  ORF type:complete len:319 (+),score=64.24 gnl/MRDRNA2_/MRDRNA2_66740_c0_seq2:106-957(+)